jgi:hypothetical protein
MSEQAKSKKTLVARLLNSPFCLILLALICFDALLTGVVPMAIPDWYLTQFPNANRHCAKMLNYLSSSGNEPIVMMGSSLLLSPSQKVDMNTTRPELLSFANDYNRADFFRSQIREKTGADAEICNLAMRGCMASDYELMVKKIWQCDKRAKMLICMTAPAEFMSNDQPVVQNTFVHQCLLTAKFWQTNPPLEVAQWQIAKLLEPHGLLAVEAVLGVGKQNLCAWLANTTGHPVDMYDAVKKLHNPQSARAKAFSAPANCGAGAVPTAKNTLADLEQFRQRYQPPNYKLFAAHKQNFAEMMRFAHEKGIPLVIVNMPITEPNKALIDKNLLKTYDQFLAQTTQQYQIPYIDIEQSGGYQIADFSDSTHLGLQGGRRFFTQLADELVKKTDLSALQPKGKQL